MNIKNNWDNSVKKKHYNVYPNETVVRFIFNYFKKNSKKKILDLGCGAGSNLKVLKDQGLDYYGLDSSRLALKIAIKSYKKNIYFGNFADQINFKDRFFDGIIDRMSLGHNTEQNIDKALINIKKKLKKGGFFLTMFFSNKCSDLKFGKKCKKNKFSYYNFSKGQFKYCDIVFAPTLQYIKKKLKNVKDFGLTIKSSFKIIDIVEHMTKSKKTNSVFYSIILQKN